MNHIIMSNIVKYVDVILPLPIQGSFTYLAAIDLDLNIGQRVVVQFGSRKLYTAIVIKIHNEKPKEYDAKELLAILDEKPIINEKQLQFWFWIAEYYMCNLGDVMNAALPSSFKLASESKVIIHSDFDGDMEDFSENETSIVNALLNHVGTYKSTGFVGLLATSKNITPFGWEGSVAEMDGSVPPKIYAIPFSSIYRFLAAKK